MEVNQLLNSYFIEKFHEYKNCPNFDQDNYLNLRKMFAVLFNQIENSLDRLKMYSENWCKIENYNLSRVKIIISGEIESISSLLHYAREIKIQTDNNELTTKIIDKIINLFTTLNNYSNTIINTEENLPKLFLDWKEYIFNIENELNYFCKEF